MKYNEDYNDDLLISILASLPFLILGFFCMYGYSIISLAKYNSLIPDLSIFLLFLVLSFLVSIIGFKILYDGFHDWIIDKNDSNIRLRWYKARIKKFLHLKLNEEG